MEITFLVFGIISLLLLIDGYSLKKGRSKNVFVRNLKITKVKEKTAFVGHHMIIAGVLSFIWILIGYALYDLLVMEMFLFIYFGILAIVGVISFAQYKKHF